MTDKNKKPFVAAIDFGTANSGAVWGPNDETKILADIRYANKTGSQGYAKTRTAFLIKKEKMDRIESCLHDLAIYGLSGVDDSNADVYFGNAVFQGLHARKRNRDHAQWVSFEFFKMALHGESTFKFKGSDGIERPLVQVIGTFLHCLKRSVLENIAASGMLLSASDIRWGVTIPTIWEKNAKTKMDEAVQFGLGEDAVFQLEPEGAAASFTQMRASNGLPFGLAPGKCYMVVDCGGGTTDIVVQKIRPDGKAEELCRANGAAAAGWNVDENFWTLLASKLAGPEFTPEMAREKLRKSLGEKGNDAKFCWLELEQKWFNLKESHGICAEDDGKRAFEMTRDFEKLARKAFGDERVDDVSYEGLIDFSTDDIREKVFRPVVDEILETAEQTASAANVSLDYVFLAGGLSGSGYLQDRIATFSRKKCGGAQLVTEALSEGTTFIAGSTIMRGACILLVYDKMIQRISKRNYYFGCCLKNMDSFSKKKAIEKLLSDYSQFDLTPEEMREKRTIFNKHVAVKSESDFEIFRESDGKIHISRYCPICLKDRAAANYVLTGLRPVCPSGNKFDEIAFNFFSSTTDLSFIFPNDNSDVTNEGNVTVKIPKEKSVSVSVDFNEVDKPYFTAKVTLDGTGELLGSVDIKPDFKIGH